MILLSLLEKYNSSMFPIHNKFDIFMIKNNHLHVIERKLRKTVPREHYIYKLDSVIDYLDDSGKGMIVVISDKNERYTDSVNVKKSFTYSSIARANSANIKIIFQKYKD